MHQVMKRNGWRESKFVRAACESYLENDLGEKFGVRLAAHATEAIRKELQRQNNHVENLAWTACYVAEQSRILQINAIQMYLALIDAEDQLPLIIADSQKEALKNLKHSLKMGAAATIYGTGESEIYKKQSAN